MAAFYQKFLRRHLDLSPQRDAAGGQRSYFCTRGALLSSAGRRGRHPLCFVRGFGEAVFAVSPMNGGKDCVHVIARDFSDFLRAARDGDSAALEQAWQWDEAQFDAFLARIRRRTSRRRCSRRFPQSFPHADGAAVAIPARAAAEFDLSKLKFTRTFMIRNESDAPNRKRTGRSTLTAAFGATWARARGQGNACTKVVFVGGARLVRAVGLRLFKGHCR